MKLVLERPCIFTCYPTYVHAHGEQWSMRNSARARKISKEQMLSTVRLAKSKALVATYLQLTKSLTMQSSKVRTQSSLPMPVLQ